jgi:DNA-binding beta-propeller fold protein YncE
LFGCGSLKVFSSIIAYSPLAESLRNRLLLKNGEKESMGKSIKGTVMVLIVLSFSLLATLPMLVNASNGAVYDSAKNELFVIDRHSSTISVVSVSDGSVLTNISMGFSLYNIAYATGRGEIIVTNSYSKSIVLVSDETNNITKTIVTGPNPVASAYNPANGLLYISNYGYNTVNVIDKKTP